MVTGLGMMTSGTALLFFLISAMMAECSALVVTDCGACSVDAACQNSPGAQNITPTCSCMAGFVGDGVSCYNRMACDAGVCCTPGYRWSSEQGCTDVDECGSSEEVCTSPLLCQNTRGSFNCLMPEEEKLPETDADPSAEPNSELNSRMRSNPSSNPRSDQRSVSFNCDGVTCLTGQDCLLINGVRQCLDPCQHYSRLDDPWRATDYSSVNVVCDNSVDWQGWYRLFLRNDSVQMPERCVDTNMCGTHAPLWLPDPHPQLSDGIVTSRVCGHWSNDCCRFQSNPIHVKACPGNYFVYKFIVPSTCSLAYCADVNTAVCGTCGEDETCVSDDKVNWRCERQASAQIRLVNGDHQCSGRVEIYHDGQWGTVCDDIWNMNNAEVACRQAGCGRALAALSVAHFGQGSGPIWLDDVRCFGNESSLTQCQHRGIGSHNCAHSEDAGVICEEMADPELVCGRSFMQVGLNRAHLEAGGLDPLSAHLADLRCTESQESHGMLWFELSLSGLNCGTQLRTNSTHSIYSNSLFVYPFSVGNVTFSLPEAFPFSCVYPLDAEASLDVAIRPHLSVEGAAVGMGPRPRAVMSLFRNANYTDPYTTGTVILPLGSALYVGVSAEEAASNMFAVILENCYATPSADPDYASRFFLIQNRCPIHNLLVKVEDSGPSVPGRFTTSVNLFSGVYDNIFLHCTLTVCVPIQAGCSQTCRSRVSRSVSLENPLTIGPISWEKASRENA